MVTHSEEIDFTLGLSLDKPPAENAEKLLTTPPSPSSSSISGDISESLVGNGASGSSSVSSLHKPFSLRFKAEKVEFQDLRTMGIPKGVNVKRLMLQKQNKVDASMIKKEMVSPGREVPSEVLATAAASVSKNPAFIRAIARIKQDLKQLQHFKHNSARGLAKGGAASRFLRYPKGGERSHETLRVDGHGGNANEAC